MFDSTDGLPGPVMMNRLGKPALVRPRYVRGRSAHLSLSALRHASHIDFATVPVMASKPVASTSVSSSYSLPVVAGRRLAGFPRSGRL